MRGKLRQQAGYLIGVDPGMSAPIENDSFTCRHCGKVVWVKPFQSDFGTCPVCDGLVCPACAAACRGERGCDPWEEKLRRAEASYNFRRDAGLER